MNEILFNILRSQTVVDEEGTAYPLHSHTGEAQGLLLQKLIMEIKPKKSLEIGLAYGISSLFILDALAQIKCNETVHYILDPEPDVYWNNIGLLNIRKAKFESMVDFRKLRSDDGLIQLIQEKQRVQFAYVDTTKVFDVVFADFYLINKILDVGGVIVFDDCGFPGIRKLVRYISKLPFYTIYATHQKDKETRTKSAVKHWASSFLQKLPFSEKILPGHDFRTDRANGIDYNCIAFRKTGEDSRAWHWSVDF